MTTADVTRDGQGAAGAGNQVKVGGDVFVIGDVARVGGRGGPALELDDLEVTRRCNGHGIGDRDTIGEFEGGSLAAEGDRASTEGIIVPGDNYAASSADTDAAREGIGRVEQQGPRRGLGQHAPAVELGKVPERTRLGVERDEGPRGADVTASQVQGAAGEGDRVSLRAQAVGVLDVTTDGKRAGARDIDGPKVK